MNEFWLQTHITQKNALSFFKNDTDKVFWSNNIQPTIDCKFTDMELTQKLMKCK